MSVLGPYHHLQALIGKIISGKYWVHVSAAVIICTSLFLHFPSYGYVIDHLVGDSSLPEWNNVLTQRDHLLTPQEHPPETHRAKTTFRLTVPLLARALFLDVAGLMVLSTVIGVLSVVLTLLLAHRLTNDRRMAFLFTACVTMTYAGSAAFFDVWGFFDGFGYFFLLLALYFHDRWYAVSAAVLLASFTDERALIASGVVLLYHWHEQGRMGMRHRLPATVLACAAAWVVYFVIRWVLARYFGFQTHTDLVGFSVLRANETILMWSLWMMFEGGWLLVLPFLVAPFYQKKDPTQFFYLAGLLVIVTVGFCVFDVTRSLAYGFVLMFPALRYLAASIRPEQLGRILFVAATITLLQPMNFIMGGRELLSVDPLPLKVIYWLLS